VNLTVSAARDASGKLQYFIAVLEDASARKDAEHKLWQAKLELQTTARHLELVTSRMAAPVARCSRDFRFLWVNQYYADWIRRPVDKIIGHSIEEVLGHEAFEKLLPYFRDVLAGKRVSYESEIEFRDIGRRWISAAYTPITDPAGYPVGWVAVDLDITERKKMEAVSRAGERHFREMLDALPAAIYTTDAEGRLTHFNSAAVEFAGRVPELDSDEWCVTWKLFHADGVTPMPHDECPMAVALKDGRILDGVEALAERPDGTRRWFTPYPRLLHDEDGRVTGGVNMLVDITERRRAQQATGLLAAIVDSSDDAIVSKNLTGVITSWNKGAERIFGYTAKEAIGQHIKMLIPIERHAEEDGILERLRRGERVDHYETVRVRKDGTLIDVSLTISPVKDAAGRIIGASKVAREITERKRAEQALTEAARQQKALFHLANELLRTESMEQIYNAAFGAIFSALQCSRAAILLCDETGVMKFAGWRGLSDGYRAAVEGHSPWALGESNPKPVTVRDIEQAEFAEQLKTTIRAEGISAMAFIPLVSNGKLIGKFMTYYDAPHDFSEKEIELSLIIAGQLAFGIDHHRDAEALRLSEERFRNLAMKLDSEVRVRTAELEERNADVLRQSEQLRELSWRLQRMQDDERRHIARELHDSAGQTLAVLGMNLGALVRAAKQKAPEVLELAAEADQLVEQLTREIRTTSYLLHPPLLDENGIPSALSWYIRGLEERSGLEIEFKISEEFGRLPRDLELAVFRVVQECLTNIHRHSGSKSAVIEIERELERLVVEVRDRGKGIPAEKLAEIQSKGAGVGIRGIRERVRQCNGELLIESTDVGTTVMVTFPVSQETCEAKAADQTLESAI
jgi:PAS domain S-box-containing protein